jgi:hypothetical protein
MEARRPSPDLKELLELIIEFGDLAYVMRHRYEHGIHTSKHSSIRKKQTA